MKLFDVEIELPKTVPDFIQLVSDVIGAYGGFFALVAYSFSPEDETIFVVAFVACVISLGLEENLWMGLWQLLILLPVYLIGENHVSLPVWWGFFSDKGNVLATLGVIYGFSNTPIVFELIGGFFKWLGNSARNMRRSFQKHQPT